MILTGDQWVCLFLYQAADIVSHMTKNSPDEVFSALTGFLGVGLFGAEEGLSVYPEHARYADRPECYGKYLCYNYSICVLSSGLNQKDKFLFL